MRRAGLGCDIDVAILSAGFGLVTEEQIIVPYDITFSSMGKQEIQAWADFLDIPASVQQWFEAKGDLNLVLLGDAYLEAASMDASWQIATPTILFCGSVAASRLPDWHNVRKVTLTREDARRLRQGLVWIKGYLASRLLERVCREPGFLHRLFDLHLDLIGELAGLSEAGKQLSLLYPPAK
ncbi:MAG: hypothetical protein KatS3mg015_2432 [Fimbriimonadales bacterium]|nr:MAG: hypothetical protein KatS3mg015_2432 [Fimbriimonadales bacterium]